MIRKYFQLLVLGFLVSLFSCDVIEGSFIEEHNQGEEPVKNPRNALVFDFTGHTCKSCPKAHRALEQLVELYGDQVVPVAFHVGYFAKPQSGEKFTADFRTPEGNELEPYYEIISYPIGLVNELGKEQLSPYASWASSLAPLVAGDAEVYLEGRSVFNETSNSAHLHIHVMQQEVPLENLKLAIYLTEDHIISWQKDEDSDPMDVENYEHNHVFRDAIGSVWGEAISFTSLEEIIEFDHSIKLQPSWVPINCSFVIFVYDSSSLEVKQSLRIPIAK